MQLRQLVADGQEDWYSERAAVCRVAAALQPFIRFSLLIGVNLSRSAGSITPDGDRAWPKTIRKSNDSSEHVSTKDKLEPVFVTPTYVGMVHDILHLHTDGCVLHKFLKDFLSLLTTANMAYKIHTVQGLTKTHYRKRFQPV